MKMNKNLSILLILCVSVINAIQHVLSTVQGRLRGIPQEGYVSYIGIPYATVAGNIGRFRRAGTALVWTDIDMRESSDPHCSSTSPAEDCLQLDVHVPSSGSALPVLVWVKGGSGSYHPGKLVAQGIIVVMLRHRLGVLGFLCSKKEKIPGNAGIKDVLLGLRWVRDNIVAFNGNPHRLVVGGQSFGAAMVEALTLLPSSQGLYQGVILQSGSIICPWAFNFDAEDRANALRRMINDTEDTIDSTPSIVKTDTVTLASKADDIVFPYMPYGICIEKPLKNEESVILEPPFNLLLKGKTVAVPMLMGYNTNEAYIFASKLMEAKVTSRMTRDLSFLLPEELQTISKSEIIQVTKLIKDMYFQENMNLAAVLAYHRDAYFLSHIHRSLRFHAAHQPVYYYQFSHSGDAGVSPEPGAAKAGAAHSDDLAYLFGSGDLADDDGVVQKHFITLWSNFVKHLNPTPDPNEPVKWEPADAHQPRVLDINTDLKMKEFPHAAAVRMWNGIYEKYYYTRRY